MQIECFAPGDVVTVLNGHKSFCPCGCEASQETYTEIKGLPLVILAIDPPYVVTAHVVGPGGRVIDSRYCELTKCSNEYVTAFRQIVSAPTPAAQGAVKVRIVDGSGEDCAGK